jgi:hypothetical protein
VWRSQGSLFAPRSHGGFDGQSRPLSPLLNRRGEGVECHIGVCIPRRRQIAKTATRAAISGEAWVCLRAWNDTIGKLRDLHAEAFSSSLRMRGALCSRA